MSGDTKVIGGVLLLTAVIMGLIFAFGGKTAPERVEPAVVSSPELLRAGHQRTGAENATVTLVEFADFQCPACGAMHPVLKQLLAEFPDQLALIHRDYPLPTHPNAEIAARAAFAAGKQNKFWEMHSKLFETQTTWSAQLNPQNTFLDYAQEMSLDTNKFEDDMLSEEASDVLRYGKGDGNALGVSGTPSFYINGEEYTGGLSYDALKAAIQAKL